MDYNYYPPQWSRDPLREIASRIFTPTRIIRSLEELDEAPPLFPPKTFTIPRADHSYSRLMNLPRELRAMIIRHLLRHNSPLTISTTKFERLKSTESGAVQVMDVASAASVAASIPLRLRFTLVMGYVIPEDCAHQLHPTILASCQNLLVEGSRILYSENTLLLMLANLSVRGSSIPPSLWIPCIGDCLLTVEMSEPRKPAHDFVARFSKLKLELDIRCAESKLVPWGKLWKYLGHTFRAIGTRYVSKILQISCTSKEVLQSQHFQAILELLQYIRFRNLSFAFEPQIKVRQQIIDVVTSASSVVDLHYYHEKACRHMNVYDRLKAERKFDESLKLYMAEMSNFVIVFDVLKFREAYKGFVNQYLDLIKTILSQ